MRKQSTWSSVQHSHTWSRLAEQHILQLLHDTHCQALRSGTQSGGSVVCWHRTMPAPLRHHNTDSAAHRQAAPGCRRTWGTCDTQSTCPLLAARRRSSCATLAPSRAPVPASTSSSTSTGLASAPSALSAMSVSPSNSAAPRCTVDHGYNSAPPAHRPRPPLSCSLEDES